MEKKINYWNKTNSWEAELDILKQIVIKSSLIETIKWGGSVYTYNNKNIVGLAGFKNYFAIWFYNGVLLKDENKFLMNAQENVTKNLRQWRFTSKEEINENLISKYINEAIEIEKQGLVAKSQKKEKISSEFLDTKFKNNLQLKDAFDSFTPYKQREFLEYIETAKQEKTKISRFEKIMPLILNRIGLNDQYKK